MYLPSDVKVELMMIEQLGVTVFVFIFPIFLFLIGFGIYMKIRYGTVELSCNGIGVLICCGIALFLSTLMVIL